MVAIHRVVEEHAAARGDFQAVIEGDRALTYRELNQCANTIARRLVAQGFRRGAHAWVRMPRSADLALVLLGILKAGGSYTWLDAERSGLSFPSGLSISVGSGDAEDHYAHLDFTSLLRDHTPSSPNLPIVTRGSDIACILRDDEGSPVILVPHAAMTALQKSETPQPAAWTGEPGALDLLMALVTGRTAVVDEQTVQAAAA